MAAPDAFADMDAATAGRLMLLPDRGPETGALHLVQFSTGAGSAEVAWRVVDQYGPGSVVLMTADTRVEDDDNWRFAAQVVERLGCRWERLADGRTPMQVGRDRRIVPNNRMPVCSTILKSQILRRHLDAHYDPANSVVYLGYDWTEPERHDRSVERWKPWQVRSPLMDSPYLSKPDLLQRFERRGIRPPRLYELGFPHANCGGACVRGGQAQWQRLLAVNRDRYLSWEAEEQTTRTLLGKDVAILRDRRGGTVTPLTLARFRAKLEDQPDSYDVDDWGACGCTESSTDSPPS
ncbi:hypothetical protein ACIGO9_31780 [Nocardia asteroides]|uniref:hypothetical protein n=1 Tax=Nocardia asteroides TaxID=1824 RepID=UPI0037C6E9D5